MFEDEPAEPRRVRRLEPLRLEGRDVAELRLYVEELRAEIARTEAEITRRAGVGSAAEALFRRPT